MAGNDPITTGNALNPRQIENRALTGAREQVLSTAHEKRVAELSNKLNLSHGRALFPTFTNTTIADSQATLQAPGTTPLAIYPNGSQVDPLERRYTLSNPLERILGLTANGSGLSSGSKAFLDKLAGQNSELSAREKASMKGTNATKALNELARFITQVKGDPAQLREYQVAVIALANLRGVRLDSGSLKIMNDTVGYTQAQDFRDNQTVAGGNGYGLTPGNYENYGQPSTAGKVMNWIAGITGGVGAAINANRNGSQNGGWFNGITNFFRN